MLLLKLLCEDIPEIYVVTWTLEDRQRGRQTERRRVERGQGKDVFPD